MINQVALVPSSIHGKDLRMNWRRLVYTDGRVHLLRTTTGRASLCTSQQKGAWDLVYTAPLATHKVATRRGYVYD